MAGIFFQVQSGHALVDRALGLESHLLSEPSGTWKQIPAVVAFATGRAREAVRFTGALYMTAWRDSEEIRLPGWIDRAETDRLGR